MPDARLIQDFRDASYRPTRRTIADGLARLEQELGANPDIGRCHLHVPHQTGRSAFFATLWYRSFTGDDIIIAYPSSRGCRARTTLGVRIGLSLEQLDGALLDEDANVLLGRPVCPRAGI